MEPIKITITADHLTICCDDLPKDTQRRKLFFELADLNEEALEKHNVNGKDYYMIFGDWRAGRRDFTFLYLMLYELTRDFDILLV